MHRCSPKDMDNLQYFVLFIMTILADYGMISHGKMSNFMEIFNR